MLLSKLIIPPIKAGRCWQPACNLELPSSPPPPAAPAPTSAHQRPQAPVGSSQVEPTSEVVTTGESTTSGHFANNLFLPLASSSSCASKLLYLFVHNLSYARPAPPSWTRPLHHPRSLSHQPPNVRYILRQATARINFTRNIKQCPVLVRWPFIVSVAKPAKQSLSVANHRLHRLTQRNPHRIVPPALPYSVLYVAYLPLVPSVLPRRRPPVPLRPAASFVSSAHIAARDRDALLSAHDSLSTSTLSALLASTSHCTNRVAVVSFDQRPPRTSRPLSSHD